MAAREKSASLLILGCNPPNPVVVRRPLGDAHAVTGGGVVERASATERRAAARLVAPHPDRQYRPAHLPRPGQSLWRRARRASRPGGGPSAPARICSHEAAQAELKAARAVSTSSRSASRIIRRACR